MTSTPPPRWCERAEGLPDLPGAYLLLIELPKAAALPRALGGGELPAGRYLYAGSARGAGGIRARCRRHLRRDKRRRWHVDWLTGEASRLQAAAFAGDRECRLVGALRQLGLEVPVAGFGSSDCRRCPAHLLRLPAAGGARQIPGAVARLIAGE